MMGNLYDRECILKENIQKVKFNIEKAAASCKRNLNDITLVAATKTVSADVINIAVQNGINNIGENRVQELVSKFDHINKCKVGLHFIGHLQKNKVKDIVGKVNLIQSVDSFELAQKISQLSENLNVCSDILVQVNIGKDVNKFGVDSENTQILLHKISLLPNIKVRGLMSILPICEKKTQSYSYFCKMNDLFVDITAKNIDNVNMDFLSMGMSSDYITAIECGANMVRVGSALFGARV